MQNKHIGLKIRAVDGLPAILVFPHFTSIFSVIQIDSINLCYFATPLQNYPFKSRRKVLLTTHMITANGEMKSEFLG